MLTDLELLYNGVVGVSTGPDSMFLLEMLRKSKREIVVAFVNYNIRAESVLEEKYIIDYCKKHQLRLEILSVDCFNIKGNFQNYARNARYDFFVKLLVKYSYSHIYVAHHLYDDLETYLIEEKKKNIPLYYGLIKETPYKSYTIVRPMLSLLKGDIISYLRDNKIKYFIDSSNLSSKYLRNAIRKRLQRMSKTEIDLLILKKNKANKDRKVLNDFFDELIKKYFNKDSIAIESFINLEVSELFLSYLINTVLDLYLSQLHIGDIIRQIRNGKLNKSIKGRLIYLFNDRLYLVSNYVAISPIEYVDNDVEIGDYLFSNNDLNDDSIMVDRSDYPLYLRAFVPGDQITLKDGKMKKLKSFYIDLKIPRHQRVQIPMLVNKDNVILYIPNLYHLRKVGTHKIYSKLTKI